ncbi:Uncharacterised protein [Serratia entomophila]|nr:Uncharacterised protein [Serratia entomophila]CAI0813405.1 Uncharacterised protein [Serratia entomophila]CAI0853989.1 Uncharacterised protein [Serratia entomophila]CAI0870667.1 Uncharacterised protein [Serratia entomophila]CAI0878234.1 Uncharacterised protein [Serratia entomophila]
MQNRLKYSGWDNVINRIQTSRMHFNQDFIRIDYRITDVIES